MITVIFQTIRADDRESAEPIARSFAPLVRGAMEGVVSEVIVWSPENHNSPDLQLLCDGAGAHLLQGVACKVVLDTAKSNWLLLLEPGAVLWGDWYGGVLHHINHMQQAGHFQLSSEAPQKPWWRRIFSHGPHQTALRRGFLVPKAMAKASSKSTLEAIANGRALKQINGGTILPPQNSDSL